HGWRAAGACSGDRQQRNQISRAQRFCRTAEAARAQAGYAGADRQWTAERAHWDARSPATARAGTRAVDFARRRATGRPCTEHDRGSGVVTFKLWRGRARAFDERDELAALCMLGNCEGYAIREHHEGLRPRL